VGLIEALSARIECGVAEPNDDLAPTGIPPHIVLLSEMSYVRNGMDQLKETHEQATQMIGGTLQLKNILKGMWCP
jgi:hypothetical protein